MWVPIRINPYRRHPRPEAIFLFVGPYSKNKEEGVTWPFSYRKWVMRVYIFLDYVPYRST